MVINKKFIVNFWGNFVFYRKKMFKYLMIICCLGIYTVNPIQSLLWLVMVFLLAGIVLIELGSEFLAILIFLIYVGAIAVLFLFVIMLLNIRKVELYNYYINYKPIIIFISILFFLEIFFVILIKYSQQNIGDFMSIDFLWINSLYYTSNIEVIGIILFDIYYYYFFLLSLILLTALLGTLILLVNVKTINISTKDFYKKKNGNINFK